MLKNTVNGSFFAQLFPNASKWFLENASQDVVNKAEQEAAVVHQQMQSGIEATPPAPVAGSPATPAAAGAGQASSGQLPLDIPAPQPSASELTTQLTAMTGRATTAENQVASLTQQLASANQDRDRYKAWHDKHKTLATALPVADASNGDAQQDATLSTASANALAQFRKSKGIV